MQEDLNDMAYFAAVVQYQGFTAAGRMIGVSKSVLSRRIEALEARLGVRLLNRTSRHFSVTDVGMRYAQECRKLLELAQEARQVIDQAQQFPQGFLRITAPVMMAEVVIAPIVSRFLQLYPQVTCEVLGMNSRVDLLEENVDVAIRTHEVPLEDSSLYRRPLGQLRNLLVASPAFIAQCAVPPSIDTLEQLPVLTRHSASSRSEWRLHHAELGSRSVQVQARLRSNKLMVVMQAAIDGLGVALISEHACHDALAEGKLELVMPDWHTAPSYISALYANKRGQSSALRAFLDYLSQAMGAE